MGVGYGKVNFLPICNSDWNNLDWSGKAVLASITFELWENIEKYLEYDTSGPGIFCGIIQNQKQVNSSAVCALVQALKKMRLVDEPGQDVENFGNKMAEMARHIIIIGPAPNDLSTLVATVFVDC